MTQRHQLTFKANQEGLQRYANKEIGRVRKDRPPPETSHPVAKKLADQISMVLKEFSSHSFTSGKPEDRVRVCTWSLKPLPNLPRLSQMIHA